MADQHKGDDRPAHDPGVRRGEELIEDEGKEAGRHDAGHNKAGRPKGKSSSRNSTSINPDKEDPIDPKSPKLPPA
jgi:hypothetical protein